MMRSETDPSRRWACAAFTLLAVATVVPGCAPPVAQHLARDLHRSIETEAAHHNRLRAAQRGTSNSAPLEVKLTHEATECPLDDIEISESLRDRETKRWTWTAACSPREAPWEHQLYACVAVRRWDQERERRVWTDVECAAKDIEEPYL